MARFIKDRSASQGTVPGSLIHIGQKKMTSTVIHVMDIEAENLIESDPQSIQEAAANQPETGTRWINIWGIHDIEMVRKLGEIYNFSPLLLENILNTDQRPGYEGEEEYDAFILKLIDYDTEKGTISSDQCTMILGENYLITLQEQRGTVFDPVRERIRNAKKRLRFIDADYLTYSLIDTIVDKYILVIEALGRRIEEMDERIFSGPDPKLIQEIHRLKTELSFLRKSIRPVREILAQLMKTESEVFQEKYKSYLRDLNDLVIHATDTVELYTGMISDHLNIYSTNINNKTNDIMKVLTVFASIFIPLTFIAGIYGMNFQYMPELEFKYSYFIFWGVVLIVCIILFIYFKRKKWL